MTAMREYMLESQVLAGLSLTADDGRVFEREREQAFLDLVFRWLDSNRLHLYRE
jgi:hypothetical protein